MADLEPITREEMLLDGQDLEPITRKEMFIKRIYDKTQVIPEPITREEIFLKKAGDETTDVTIEQLTATENRTYSEEGVAYSPVIVNVPQTTLTTLDVTENGTYTAPSGTAYNEVDVNVPLPENAYLLKDIPATPASIATFTDGSALPMPKLEVAVEPQQDLHGYDAPWVGGSGKNKLRINSFNSTTQNGVTFTYDNGVINANGTATNDIIFVLPLIGVTTNYTTIDNIVDGIIADTNYILTGCTNGTPQTYWIQILISGSGSEPANYNNPATFSFTAEQIASQQRQIAIRVKNGTQMNNVKFYPMIRLASVTDATFAPYSNECPISGGSAVDVTRCGAFLISKDDFEQGTYGQHGEEASNIYRIRSNDFIPVIGGKELRLFYSPSTISFSVAIFDSNDTSTNTKELDTGWLNSGSKITIPNNGKYMRILAKKTSNVSTMNPSDIGNIRLFYEDTYSTITIQLGDTYYGGTLDVVSGVLTVTHGIKVYSGNSSEGWYADGTQSGSTYRMKASDVPSNIKLPPSNADAMSAISNQFIAIPADNIFLGNEGIGVPVNGGYLTIYDSVYNTNDVSLWKTHLASNPLQIVYELATPLTIQLTPTQVNSLLGVNNIFANSGKVLDGSYFSKGGITI